MDRFQYRYTLKNNLKQSAKILKLQHGWLFQHDHYPKHDSILANDWFKKNHPELLFLAPYSPDLNPIEHLGTI
ncbi:hypothetical protein RvY_11209 [Ramazzottius varieornatus]|uniref:Tc1-like transposase DDE domain-containing protein n=1 Tax=Ramazzottius varieornatus TaxID=947166 RepID=A0A1D1VHS3_RAMVA|nr:hypothetical protein RvY_11209 [Ramazzottius varieornatus]